MTVNPLPPQAYTKETLQRAYAWLLTQTPSVKEMATSQEMLVSMYLKAQRDGDAILETPSIQNFKQELKSLASMMGDLQPNQARHTQPNVSQPAHQQTVHQQTAPAKNFSANSQPAMSPHQAAANSHQVKNNMPQTFASAPPSNHVVSFTLDEQSMLAIEHVKRTFNLSSDSEALRALISLGHKQIQKI
jgi:hypothetical protein